MVPGDTTPTEPGAVWVDAYSGWIFRRGADGFVSRVGPTREQHLADMMRLRLHRHRYPSHRRPTLIREMGWPVQYFQDVEFHLAEWETTWIRDLSSDAVISQVVGRLESACQQLQDIVSNPRTKMGERIKAIQTFMQGQSLILKALQDAGAAPKAASRVELVGRVGVLHASADPDKLKEAHARAAQFIMKYVSADGALREAEVDNLLEAPHEPPVVIDQDPAGPSEPVPDEA